MMERNDPPSWIGGKSGHLLGTDQLGRDVLSRCIYALRVSVGIALLGVTSAVHRGRDGHSERPPRGLDRPDHHDDRRLPALHPVPADRAGRDRGLWDQHTVLILLVGTAHWETYARLTRGQVLTVREFQFVEAAVALGPRTADRQAAHPARTSLPPSSSSSR